MSSDARHSVNSTPIMHARKGRQGGGAGPEVEVVTKRSKTGGNEQKPDPDSATSRAKKTGRPTLLTPEVHKAIVTAVKLGCYKAVAARAVGIGQRTLETWLEKGRAEDAKEPYASFAADVDAAEGECEQAMVRSLRRSADQGDMKSVTWFLERRFPKRWGSLNKHELTGPDGGPIATEAKVITVPENALFPKADDEADHGTE